MIFYELMHAPYSRFLGNHEMTSKVECYEIDTTQRTKSKKSSFLSFFYPHKTTIGIFIQTFLTDRGRANFDLQLFLALFLFYFLDVSR